MVSEGLDRHLSLPERATLKLHLSMCRSCTNFQGQMQLMRKAMRKFPFAESPPKDEDKR